MLTSIVEFACSNFCATTTQVKMKVSNKREKGGGGDGILMKPGLQIARR
jgi:hypothetical protein